MDLRRQLNSVQVSNKSGDLIDTNTVYQKSAFMEEFEEVMPSSELGDYINLQKEIKRLNEENFHLSSENKELIGKLKFFRQSEENAPQSTSLDLQQDYERKLEKLEKEIFVSLKLFFFILATKIKTHF
jgi:regulator of replication initiation timing